MTYVSCFNSSTIGTLIEYEDGYFHIQFPGLGLMWVHESNVNNLWSDEDDE